MSPRANYGIGDTPAERWPDRYDRCVCGKQKTVVSGYCKHCYFTQKRAKAKFAHLTRSEYDAQRYNHMSAREHLLRKKYGLSLEQYEDIYRRQEGCCGICGVPFAGGEARLTHGVPVVDHDHHTGSVRGLLCDLCNKGLGQFKDSADLMRAALAYLERTPAVVSEPVNAATEVVS